MGKFGFAVVVAALVLLSGMPYAQCASYGESCASNPCCAGVGLICDGTGSPPLNRCVKEGLFCDPYPAAWHLEITDSQLNQPGSVNFSISSQQAGNEYAVIRSDTGLYRAGWFSDWRMNGIIGIAIAISIVALAAMAGKAFNLPELRAFADVELMQCVISLLLIIGIIAVITFFDELARLYVSEAGLPINCGESGTPCYVQAAHHYLTTIYDIGNQYASDQLIKSVRLQAFANTGNTVQANLWQLMFAGVSTRPDAGLTIEAERAAQIFDTASKMLASIYAQRYFMDVVSFGLAPILFLIGILLRTLFFTRKLGGLLLAMALALFLVYPLTYAFTWYTLNVQIYGERVSAVDPYCPQECTMKAPVAFYLNGTGGNFVQFSSKQEVTQAGLTTGNWESGGPDGKYVGLVSCVPSLLGTNVPSNGCPDCPSYCREVPFPSHIPGCDIQKCAACNPGCKVMRLRSDCTDPGVCDPQACPDSCRSKLPYENKCFYDTEGGIAQANLSVSCAGCDGCPTWCKIRKLNPDGSTAPLYNDAACNINACKKPSCPDQCVYLTPFGSDSRCDVACSAGGTVCPKPCRFKTGLDLSLYDVEDYNATLCNSTTYRDACNACPDACKAELPPDPRNAAPQQPACYPYPTDPYVASKCTDCPDYCRFENYDFIPGFSNTSFTEGVPSICASEKISCSGAGLVACDNSCKASPAPPVCVAYHSLGGGITDENGYCNKCAESERILLVHTDKNGVQDFSGAPAFASPSPGCQESNCGNGCKPELEIPGENSQGAGTCKDYSPSASGTENCAKCAYECRLTGVTLSGACGSNCDSANCPDSCKATGQTGYTCEAYQGAGTQCVRKSQSSAAPCGKIANRDDCNGPIFGNACEWKEDPECFGPESGSVNCRQQTDRSDCTSHADIGCRWLKWGDPRIPIAQRDGSVSDRTECRLCPENCRTGATGSSCGLEDNTFEGSPNAYFDCSVESCGTECRATLTKNDALCKEFIPFGLQCYGVPALCRRTVDSMPELPYCNNNAFCGSQCLTEAPPAVACGGCNDCPYDCIYTPAVRTDCSEVCSDESLSGVVNIGPDDFIKKLPGASGATDVKNVGVLLVLGLVMPLFNIVIVISFVRVFSPILGGDIEIPGLGRII